MSNGNRPFTSEDWLIRLGVDDAEPSTSLTREGAIALTTPVRKASDWFENTLSSAKYYTVDTVAAALNAIVPPTTEFLEDLETVLTWAIVLGVAFLLIQFMVTTKAFKEALSP